MAADKIIARCDRIGGEPGVLARPPRIWTGETPVAPPEDGLFGDGALFALRPQDAIDRVRGALRWLMIMAHLHFSEQADGEHVQTREQQDGGEHHQRAVLGHHICLVQELLQNEPAGNSAARHYAEHPNRAEEMQRAGKIFEQEADGDEVEEDAEGARDSVMRSAAFPVHVLDGYFDNRRAVPRRQRRNEAVELSVERDLSQDFAAVSFESGAEVVDVNAAQLGHEPVGAARREAAQPEIVDAILAPSADDVVALGNFFEEQW